MAVAQLRFHGDWSQVSSSELVRIVAEFGGVFGDQWHYVECLNEYPLGVARRLREAAKT